MRDDNLLFYGQQFRNIAEGQKRSALEEIANTNPNKLLNTPTADFADYLKAKFAINIPVLLMDKVSLSNHDQNYQVSDYGQNITVTGTRFSLNIPFDGEAGFFRVQASTFSMSPPRGRLSYQNLIFDVIGRNLEATDVKRRLDQEVQETQKHLTWLRNDASQHAEEMHRAITATIEARKKKLLADSDVLSAIGYPIAVRSDAPTTYVSSVARKKVFTAPQASTQPYKPEPVLEEAVYQSVLSVIGNMTSVMERTPSAFKTMGEEDLRMHYLVHLNGQFQGKATGETFNFTGKTDILIRDNDRNIFVAECKFWHGEKGFLETVDQILGYLNWRDTKAAILVFNRNKDFSAVLERFPIRLHHTLRHRSSSDIRQDRRDR